ncbi:hypothetical protein TRFO_06219 [Tritrichomonas foetus]|uniref:CID domain-containing protein n=1 Tax=Tritrichomonas foetus TaxID=1144522 RepID=A0A1J4K5M3_9EUKA|nr:hypothetical protein TRFO_06219 [Tritrichomonas foetus]|eukprot:OHT04773.1 hypothetical protein TRFO_06219 [Tritrichomonas foetus]
MGNSYTEEELRQIYESHLQTIEDTEIGIQRLGLYALFNHTKYNVFIDALLSCFNQRIQEIPMQLAYIHLVNEILNKESPENVTLFLPLIERMMIKAAETKDENHIRRSKRVLAVLMDRKILDSKFVERVYRLMDSHEAAGIDEDTAVVDQFYNLVNNLIKAKQNFFKINADKDAPESLKIEAAKKEKEIRNEITDFYTVQINSQYKRIEFLDKTIDDEMEDNDKLLEGGSSDDLFD